MTPGGSSPLLLKLLVLSLLSTIVQGQSTISSNAAARTTPTTVTTTPSTATTKITTTPTTARTTRGPSILENAEGKNIYKLRDPDGNILKVYNFTGCHWTVPGADIQCAEGSYIAAIRNIFYFLNPQNLSKCNLCSVPTGEGCYDTCCSRNEVNECIFYEDPTKDLITRVKICSVTSFCPKQTFGWTSLDTGYRRCFPDIFPRSKIYSQTAELQYICVKGDWELLMTNEEDPKSGSSLFLNSFRDNHFNPHKIGFNLSCTLSAEDKKTIEITALDLRLCSDFEGASDTRPCGQRMIITEPQNQPYVIDVTSNDDQGYLGLKKVYLSKTNQVTIQVQSDGIESSFNVWLYVEPSGGKITGKCSAPILFTTTTTTTTTTAPSTATSKSTRRRVTTSTVHVSSPSTTTGILSGTTTTADGKNIYKLRDPDGNILKVYNFTGCHWTVPGADIKCAEGSYIAAIRNIFYFLNPENISKCSFCSVPTGEGCYDTCCSRNEVNECIFYEDPTKDLITPVKICSVTSVCPKQNYGWTSLDPGYRRCFPDIEAQSQIYSQTAELQYICVKGDWELLMTHEEEPKSGSALFLNSFRDNHFNPHKIGFNLSCTLSAEDNKTIEITALDLRLCSDFEGASNTRPCGQRMIITEPKNQPSIIDVTSNDDQGYLGLKKVYLSKTNQVTIQVQSDGIESSFNVWLYVEPSGGKITGKCSAPILFTTTTTTTTTTAPSTATSKSTSRRVITSTVHVSSPKTTTGIISGTTTTADGHVGHSGGEAGGEHYVNPDASSQLDQVLIYEKISVTGVWATFLIIFIFLIWAYRKLRAKSKQFRLGQTQSHEVPQMRNTKANVYATPPFSNSAYEPGRERISRHSYNLPQDVTRPPPLPPQQTKSRIYEKTPAPSVPTRVRAPDRPRDNTASRQSERTSSSVQGARLVLVDLVMKEVKSDAEIERALKSTSTDVRSAIEAMDTKTLRQTYDDIQKMKRDRNSTYETVRN